MTTDVQRMSLPRRIVGGVAGFFTGLGRKAAAFFNIFRKGGASTRLSYFIMGAACLRCRQFVKGGLYLLAQAAFLLYLFTAGAPALAGLVTLGTKTQGWVFDEKLGINVLQSGDNSMLFLIFGVLAVLLCLLFLALYFSNIRTAWRLQELRRRGKPIPSFADELRELMDTRFHVTLLALPVLGVLVFTVLPLVFMILIAFTNYDAAHQPPGNLFTWVGFANFGQMLFGSSRMAGTFFPVFFWTIIWAVLATFSNYIFGILFALMINKKGVRIKGVWRTIFVLTIAVPQFVSLLIMRNMLNDYGPINELLLSLGWITERIPFLTDPFLAKVSVLVVNLWLGIPYTMLITTGILMNIPEDQYEAARVDGASPLVVFFKITLPQILFVTTPYLITQFIANINNFNVIYLLTGGGPTNSEYYFAGHTDLLVTWLYKLTADRKDYSIASTIGILVFLISVIVSLITFTRSASYRKEEAFG